MPPGCEDERCPLADVDHLIGEFRGNVGCMSRPVPPNTGETGPPPRRSLRCRLGWHKFATVCTWDGVILPVGDGRCQRRGCDALHPALEFRTTVIGSGEHEARSALLGALPEDWELIYQCTPEQDTLRLRPPGATHEFVLRAERIRMGWEPQVEWDRWARARG
jgi:hypothetical protein